MRFSLSRCRVQLVLTAVWSPGAITVIKRPNIPAPCKALPIPGPAPEGLLSISSILPFPERHGRSITEYAVSLPWLFLLFIMPSQSSPSPKDVVCCMLWTGRLWGRQSWADPRGPWSRARQVQEHLPVSPEVGSTRLQVSETRPEVWRSGERWPQELNPRAPRGGGAGCLRWSQGDCGLL